MSSLSLSSDVSVSSLSLSSIESTSGMVLGYTNPLVLVHITVGVYCSCALLSRARALFMILSRA